MTAQAVFLHHSQVLEESKTILITVNVWNFHNVKLIIWLGTVYHVRTLQKRPVQIYFMQLFNFIEVDMKIRYCIFTQDGLEGRLMDHVQQYLLQIKPQDLSQLFVLCVLKMDTAFLKISTKHIVKLKILTPRFFF